MYSWLSNRSHIEKMASSPTTAKMKCRRAAGTGTTLTKEAEEPLVERVQGMRNDGVPLTTHMLRRRHGLSLRARTRIGQQTPEDGLAVLGTFSARIRKIVEEENIDVVYNVDQTAENYEYMPTKTLNKTGEYTVWVWCVLFRPAPTQRRSMSERVPPSYTWICQPADVAWNRPLKARLRQNWLDMIRHQLLRPKQRGESFKLVPPTRGDIVSWVADAWKGISTTTILNGFMKCQLVDGLPVIDDGDGGVLEDDVLTALMATSSIEETIDQRMDFTVSVIDEVDGATDLVDLLQ
ncbi:hypothetical protein DYB25_004087 [Aphanomyces astaci]|uniref:DDE-1 domain-containing protein n=1 Tax=Aphanomyces astaci TaxID=112090 RepID=A0A397BGA0_APHAT|nr:hypothetical protein DYB25_004087 [Aphanomyces astaci]RHY51477.1 hypothetical protein DYB30_006162 [Aphanomyces astaci]RHZ01125.1 hypothetical protein DYB31_005607 [Aphanomyces astaci]